MFSDVHDVVHFITVLISSGLPKSLRQGFLEGLSHPVLPRPLLGHVVHLGHWALCVMSCASASEIAEFSTPFATPQYISIVWPGDAIVDGPLDGEIRSLLIAQVREPTSIYNHHGYSRLHAVVVIVNPIAVGPSQFNFS